MLNIKGFIMILKPYKIIICVNIPAFYPTLDIDFMPERCYDTGINTDNVVFEFRFFETHIHWRKGLF
jgi:hypothetical protein